MRQRPNALMWHGPSLARMQHQLKRKKPVFLAKKILATNLILTGALIGTAALTLIAYGCKNKKDSSVKEGRT